MLGRVCSCLAVAGALAAAPAAAGDGFLFASTGGSGVEAPDGTLRFVPVGVSRADDTVLEAISTKGGSIENQLELVGLFGNPYTAGGAEGMSHDGTTLVLQNADGIRSPSTFAVVDVKRLRLVHEVQLSGVFSYDALSPDGSRLYLIQYTQGRSGDLSHYVVRAYDLERERLLPGRIADRTQKSWVMRGSPVTRTTSGDGRWVYTLYTNPGGYPFVHALDTVRGVAHCVGLPLRSQKQIYAAKLALHGSTLSVKPWFSVDTKTWRVSRVSRASFPWWSLAFLALVPLALPAGRRRESGVAEPAVAEHHRGTTALLLDPEAHGPLL
jgi:hypothetical protein